MTLGKITFKMLAATLVTAVFFTTGCDKHDHSAEENITTVEVRLTGPGFDSRFLWDDTDGDGTANTLDTIQLPALTGNIQCRIGIYDRSVSPELDLTGEIEAESNEHLFVLSVNNAGGLTISNLNTDGEGNPFGLTSTWQTNQPAGAGSVRIRLYHEPSDKNNNTNPGGEVDFDITFPVVIK